MGVMKMKFEVGDLVQPGWPHNPEDQDTWGKVTNVDTLTGRVMVTWSGGPSHVEIGQSLLRPLSLPDLSNPKEVEQWLD